MSEFQFSLEMQVSKCFLVFEKIFAWLLEITQ